MAFSSTFHERLELMDRTRNQRQSLLKAEKELQASKSLLLASKLASIRSMEQRCLRIEQKIASQNIHVLALKTEIENLDRTYNANLQELRALRGEVEDLEDMERSKDLVYGSKHLEMKEFRENVGKFVVEHRVRVEESRDRVNKMKSSFAKCQEGNRDMHNPEIAAAEMKKTELLTIKENLDKELASNHQIRAQLQKQLRSILITTRNQ